MAVLEGFAGVSHVCQRGKATEEAAVDGGCSLAVELLVDDGLGEGLKRALFRGNVHGEWADAGDELGEFGVGGGERGEGCGGVVGRRLGAGGVRVGHGESVISMNHQAREDTCMSQGSSGRCY